MSKGRPDPNATIELRSDALDQIELIDNEPIPQPSPPASGERSSRLNPPPLPASTVPTAPPVRRRGAGRTAASALIILVVVAAAIAAGLFFGARMRAEPSPAAAAPSAAAPTASAAPSASTLVLPTVEIGKH